MLRYLAVPLAVASLAVASLVAAPLASAQKDAGPKPDTYICPAAASAKAVDCFLNAVEHLYTMCRQIKSIEIIEFGYEKSDEGVNGAKTEYCVDKHKLSMTRPYQAALKEATGSRGAVDGLRSLHDLWLKALAELKWVPGESDEQYKARVVKPYAAFTEYATTVRVAVEQSSSKPPVANAGAAKPSVASAGAAKAKPAAAAKSSN